MPRDTSITPVHWTAAQLALLGHTARQTLSRKDLGLWQESMGARDPIPLIETQEKMRIQEFLPLRHHRMAQSPFAFYRGSALLMAHDLAQRGGGTGIRVQLCGDAHLANFGLFAAPNRDVLFDINDFDETHPGPFEWDVLRLATSYALAAQTRGHSIEKSLGLVELMGRSYRKAMGHYALIPEIDIWSEHPDENWMERTLEPEAGKSGVRQFRDYIKKAREKNRWTAVMKLTKEGSTGRKFIDAPPLLTRIPLSDEALAKQHEFFLQYTESTDLAVRELLMRYRVIDMGHKVVGVGSVGLAAYVHLLEGIRPDDLLVIQIKEATNSVLAAFVPDVPEGHDGKRVIRGQRLMQAASDQFLGWFRGPLGREFYVRQLRDMKFKPDPDDMDLPELRNLAWLSGITLARAHARSGQSITIHHYLGHSNRFEQALAAFSEAYIAQVHADYTRFLDALSKGQLAQAREDILPPEFAEHHERGVLIAGREPPPKKMPQNSN